MTDREPKRPLIKWEYGGVWIGLLLMAILSTMMQSDSAFWGTLGASLFIVLFIAFVLMCLFGTYLHLRNFIRKRRRKRRRGETD